VIPSTGNSAWLSIERTGRIKKISIRFLFALLCGTFFLIFIILWCLSNYTNWINYREYNPKTDALEKVWIPDFSWLENTFNPSLFRGNLAAAYNVLSASSPPQFSEIPTIKLFLKNNDLEKLNQDILKFHLGKLIKKPRVNGIYESTSGDQIPVRINLRGTLLDHHQVWKPSIRIRFPKSQLLEGYRNHVLIAPQDALGFRNWASNYLSSFWNMLNVEERFVRLFINNQFFGVYNRISRLDESLTIQSNRLPGSFYRLESHNKDYIYSWDHPIGWESIGIPKNEGLKVLQNFVDVSLNTLNWTSKKNLATNLQILNEYFDKEGFAKYLALLCHASESHVDNLHNNALWLDTVSGKLVPIIMDPSGYEWEASNQESLQRPILKLNVGYITSWLMDPRNLALYIDRLHELTHSFGSSLNTEKHIRSHWRKIRDDVRADLNLSKIGNPREYFPFYLSDNWIEGLIGFIHKRVHWIEQQLSSDTIAIIEKKGEAFEIYLEGFSGAVAKRKDGQEFMVNNLKRYRHFELLPSINDPSLTKLFGTSRSYAFFTLSGKPQDYVFTHRLNGSPVLFSKPPQKPNVLKKLEGVNILQFHEPDISPVTLGPGEVIINETRESSISQTVIIKPGTKILLGPGASLIMRGPIQIEGALDRPVIIRPLDPEKPFGVFALLGKETQGSRINYLDMEGGSVHRRYNLKITGMFSVHDNPDIEIINSRFGKNLIGDDAVHFMRSKVKIKNSIFEDAFRDAMDWDLVDGEITDSVFKNSGNDGLDISMGTVRVTNSRFEKSKDKCISAGEGTKTTVTNSKFYRCNIGIAVKDRSKVKLTNNLFSENNIAYSSYRKKWRWKSGGEGILRENQFLNSVQTDIKGDKHSKVSFFGSIPENLRIDGKLQLLANSNKVDQSPLQTD
jgi:hypothetical protein